MAFITKTGNLTAETMKWDGRKIHKTSQIRNAGHFIKEPMLVTLASSFIAMVRPVKRHAPILPTITAERSLSSTLGSATSLDGITFNAAVKLRNSNQTRIYKVQLFYCDLLKSPFFFSRSKVIMWSALEKVESLTYKGRKKRDDGWSQEDDALLFELMDRYKTNNKYKWTKIGNIFEQRDPTKTASSCRNRWIRLVKRMEEFATNALSDLDDLEENIATDELTDAVENLDDGDLLDVLADES